MPMYDYKCGCGKVKEVYQEMDDLHELSCDCGQKMDRVFGRVAFVIDDKPAWWEPKRRDAEADRRAYLRKEELGGRRIRI